MCAHIITPLGSRGKWVVYLARREESYEVIDAIRSAIAGVLDRERIHAKLNFFPKEGKNIDDTHEDAYALYF